MHRLTVNFRKLHVLFILALTLFLGACNGTSGGSSGGSGSTNNVPLSINFDAQAKPSEVVLSWDSDPDTTYNLYYSTDPDCDIANYILCPDGTLVEDVTSPYTVGGLTNAQNYWFQLEAVSNGVSATRTVAAAASNANAIYKVSARPDRLMTNADVFAIAHDINGMTYLGGNFTKVGMRSGSGIPVSASTAHASAFPLVDGTVEVAISDGAGGFYIGGSFTSVGGQTRTRLAHILSNGTLGEWNPSANGGVYALVLSGNTVYVGGAFTSIDDGSGAQTRNRLAAIGTDGTLVDSWDPNAGGNVRALAVSGSTVYVGGSFGTMGGSGRGNLAAIGTDGTLSNDWTPSTNNNVLTLAVSNDVVYVGGDFYQVNGQQHNKIAAIGTDGTLSSWDPVLNNNLGGQVRAIAISGSSIYIGGTIFSVGASNEARNGLAAVDADGTVLSWTPLFNNLKATTLAISGDTVYVGGDTTGIGFEYAAAFGTDGTRTSWDPGIAENVFALAISGDSVYVGGEFTFYNAADRNHLAATNAGGVLLENWNPSADGRVNSIIVSNNTVYVGGDFTAIDDGKGGGAQTRNRLAAINTNGTLSTTWDPNANEEVNVIALDGSTIYAGGNFTNVGGVGRNHLAAINTSDGTLDPTWNPNANDVVDALTVSGSTVYVGGWFTSMGGSPRSYLAAIDTDGTLGGWAPSLDHSIFWWGSTKAVSSIVVSGSTVYVGGGFDTVDGQPRNFLAAIGTDGTLDDTWKPDVYDEVTTLAISGSTLYVGGRFTSIDDGSGVQTRNHLAAIGTDGTLDDTWDPNANRYINTLSIYDGEVYIGGHFTRIGGSAASYYWSVTQ